MSETPRTVLTDLPLFPLGLVLLPGESIPLHIFEPRYRELAARCVEADEPFAIVLEDAEGRREVACTARIARVLRRHPDGRSDILVVGEEPIELREVLSVRPYLTAVAQPLGDVRERGSGDAEEAAIAAFLDLARRVEADVDEAPPPGPRLSYRLAGRVELPVAVKQVLLEDRDEEARLARVLELLEGLRRGLVVTAEVQERARRNGRVRTAEELAAELGL